MSKCKHGIELRWPCALCTADESLFARYFWIGYVLVIAAVIVSLYVGWVVSPVGRVGV